MSGRQLRVATATVRHSVRHSVHHSVRLPHRRERFDADGRLREPGPILAAATSTPDQLAWWAGVLRAARTARP
ncbi:hypothetical protein [Streptomyces yaizuensis]|uniref:Transposase n=1 Tax=Streptomyces yaizuensis TaxID=2989713 RepID=A0ABQ5NQL6_9ACTN|nr:hypothetical protein [Streptomyces sp. YSPA8]GLF92657.1 hypothetical protein SYYSPA8_00190 [Streptomyces sp. YSPA8]